MGKCVCLGGCVAVSVRVCVFVGTQSLVCKCVCFGGCVGC